MSIPLYAYSANASALGGVIRKGKRTTVIPTVGSVSLSSAGGEASNQIDDYDRDGISFTRAQTRVGGYLVQKGDTIRHSTFAEVLLLNLRIFERLSIARMQAILTSTRDVVDTDDPLVRLEADKTNFQVALIYHGVEVDGEELELDVDNELCEAATYQDFVNLIDKGKTQTVKNGRGAVAKRDTVIHQAPPRFGALAKMAHANGNGNPNKKDIPGFGNARFGDVLVKQDRRRVNLLRISLDDVWFPQKPEKRRSVGKALRVLDGDTGGSGGVGSGDVGGNGVPIWEGG